MNVNIKKPKPDSNPNPCAWDFLKHPDVGTPTRENSNSIGAFPINPQIISDFGFHASTGRLNFLIYKVREITSSIIECLESTKEGKVLPEIRRPP